VSGGWVASSNEEHWSQCEEHDTEEDAVASAPVELDLQPGQRFWVGFASLTDYTELAESFFNWNDLQDRLMESAYENWGQEEAFEEVSDAQGAQLEKLLSGALSDWMKRHKLESSYYKIDHVKKHTAPSVVSVESSTGGSNAQDVPNEIRELQRPVLRVLGRDEDPEPGLG